ncbi:PAS domain-containing protein [Shewanella gaetbuli]|uniref:PAS domain-containing protein n=1 Tax=Shewanella gaetbuli TaxID=220752 RepID=A0A9X1ZSC0_9GAMM|nr:PAS domain-containing protein [Shewanella gaetbuli]MCL1141276.1 PAS domain-containing protein [Shewanella gaetbuli]
MFKRKSSLSNTSSHIALVQDVRWSRTQILSISAQIILLIISIIIVTQMIINLGEKSLQDDWAGQRYSELQTVASLASDKMGFMQFRTQTFANSELLKQFLANPTEKQQQKLLQSWQSLTNHIPELLGLALYDPQGKLRFSTSDNLNGLTIPEKLLQGKRSMGGQDIYSSDMAFTPIEGKLEPYIYQLAWLENPDQSINGYLVTFNSVTRLLDTIKPSFFNINSPLMLLDNQSFLYAGANQANPLPNMPDTLGASLKQSAPELWREMAMNNFGQYHSKNSTFVYLKVEIASQNENKREYFFLSYIRHKDIAARYEQWAIVLIIASVTIGLLAIGLILYRTIFLLEKKARENSIHLSNGLFKTELCYAVTTDKGRILGINDSAAKVLKYQLNTLNDRSLQRVLNISDDEFEQITSTLHEHNYWTGAISLENDNHKVNIHIHRQAISTTEQYWIVVFNDISELVASRNDAHISQLLSETTIATALTDAQGKLVNCNHSFDQLMKLRGDTEVQLKNLLGDEVTKIWNNILTQVTLQGEWQGYVEPFDESRFSKKLKMIVSGNLSQEGDLEYLIFTIEHCSSQSVANKWVKSPKSSTVLRLVDLENHFNNTSEVIKTSSSLMVMDINPEGIFSNMGDISRLETRQEEIESKLLLDLPVSYQLSQWQLGRLVLFLPQTNATQAHLFAIKILDNLASHNLDEGINIGIAGYSEQQSLKQYLANAEVALKRAKQSSDQNICQAFTRTTTVNFGE